MKYGNVATIVIKYRTKLHKCHGQLPKVQATVETFKVCS